MTRADRVLLALRDAAANPDEDKRWLSGLDLIAAGGGTRYGGRVHELRQAGWNIPERRFPDGVHRYRVVEKPVQLSAWEAA